MLLTLTDKQKEAQNIYSFYFQPEREFNFFPGQYIYLTIPSLKNDYRGPTRHFTISSAPQNGKLIRITTNIREKSAYKKHLMNMKAGDQLEASKPTGTFILDENEPGEHVLIAGGIGITPFMSFIEYHRQKDLDNMLQLIYSVKSYDEAAFVNDLQNKDGIKVNITYTSDAPSGWKGKTGRINEEMLSDLIDQMETKKFWICGPPQMVADLEKLIRKMNVKRSNIISEKFTGY